MLHVFPVTGPSLSPLFNQGDYVIVLRIPRLMDRYRPGDVVVFRHPVFGVMIKIVDQLLAGGEELLVTGANPDSLDSRALGPIPRAAVVGKVIAHFRKPSSS